jgi:WD40 repeat protein
VNTICCTHSVVEAAHGTGNAVSCVEFHEDGHLLATRGTDDCVKLWDARKFNQPLKVLLQLLLNILHTMPVSTMMLVNVVLLSALDELVYLSGTGTSLLLWYVCVFIDASA